MDKNKYEPPCPYPEWFCDESKRGLCCLLCDKYFKCKMACKNKPLNFPKGCGKYQKGNKEDVE